MKPIFIYKYNRIIAKQAGKMFNAYLDHGDEIEENFKIEETKQELERMEEQLEEESKASNYSAGGDEKLSKTKKHIAA